MADEQDWMDLQPPPSGSGLHSVHVAPFMQMHSATATPTTTKRRGGGFGFGGFEGGFGNANDFDCFSAEKDTTTSSRKMMIPETPEYAHGGGGGGGSMAKSHVKEKRTDRERTSDATRAVRKRISFGQCGGGE